MSKRKNRVAAAMGRKGGRARMKQLSKPERQALARLAAEARWRKPRATE
jgi:hypothetical protein